MEQMEIQYRSRAGRLLLKFSGANQKEAFKMLAGAEEVFDGDDVTYTYDVSYHRMQEHRTQGLVDARVTIRHKFSDGSLVLIRKAISEVVALLAVEEKGAK